MLYQDFLGTYVYHCHILVHEDAGMMQGVKVIENTDSSWLIPAEFTTTATTINPAHDQSEQTIGVRLAQNYRPYAIHLSGALGTMARRAQVGDINHDYVQDILVSSAGRGRRDDRRWPDALGDREDQAAQQHHARCVGPGSLGFCGGFLR